MDLIEKQLELEAEMSGAGLARYIKNLDRAIAEGDESVTRYGQATMATIIHPLAEAVTQFCAATSGSGRRNTAIKYLRDMDPRVVAFIVAKTVLNGITSQRLLQRAAVAVGARIEDEQRFALFEAENPGLFNTVLLDLRRRTNNIGHQRTVMVHTLNNKSGVEWDKWSSRTQFLVGKKLIELMAETVGVIRITKVTVKHNDRRYYVEATESMQGQVRALHKLLREGAGIYRDGHTDREYSIFQPSYCPMVIEPAPWTTPYDGGYRFSVRTRGATALIKNAPGTLMEDVENNVDLSRVYGALNIMQNTAWKVNAKVMGVLADVWERGYAVGKVPQREPDAVPPRSFDLPERLDVKGRTVVDLENLSPDQRARFTKWKRMAARVHRGNAARAATVMQVTLTLQVAEKFSAYEHLFFPYQLDFRGRAYALPMFLNPQGPDYAKALLTFANGKPIEDEVALGYLMVHGANTWGEDKVSFADRIAWVEENEEAIIHAGTNPLMDNWWQDADEPWQFLAFCIEYAEFQAHGWGYVSHLPVALDGSCNGLQHFSAMLRDEVGGAAVNLLPTETPADIYQQVADVARVRLEQICTDWNGDPDSIENYTMASQWLTYGIDRKIVKRPVMILPYGGTIKACRTYIAEAIAERGEAPWDEADYGKAAAWLSSHVWAAIGEVVVKAREAMAWLQKVAKIVSKGEGKPILWQTPDGFVVNQVYREMKSRTVNTTLGERAAIQVLLTEPMPDKFDAIRQRNGISPNFVHSMDACALRQYVIKAWEAGIDSFCLVHDSFGTLAADAALSTQCNREAFVDMYQAHDVLAEFAESMTPIAGEPLPELPSPGNLDLELTRESTYFIG